MKISAKINIVQNINILLFVHSLFLTSLTYKVNNVGLSTIKRQHSKNLTWWTEAT